MLDRVNVELEPSINATPTAQGSIVVRVTTHTFPKLAFIGHQQDVDETLEQLGIGSAERQEMRGNHRLGKKSVAIGHVDLETIHLLGFARLPPL